MTGLWAGRKNAGSVPYESGLERDFCTVLEFDDTVERFWSQPVRLPFERPNGRNTVGYPDFLVAFIPDLKRPHELVDVKFRDEIRNKWQHLKPRFRAGFALARAEGWTYHLRSEVEIRTPFLENAKRFLPLLREEPEGSIEAMITAAFQPIGKTTPAAILRSFQDPAAHGQVIRSLWHMVARKSIMTDFHQLVTMHSEMWLM